MARCTAEDWKYQLPWVLLGLRTTPKANGNPSTAEKVYGESLTVPGELITGDCHSLTVQRLRDTVGKFAPCQQTYTDRTTPVTPPGLSSITHVFIRNGAVRPPLTRPYRGPFHVLERNNKSFQLAIHGKDDWVSVDRLKPALLEEDVDDTPQCPLQESSPLQPTPPTRKSHGCPRKASDPGSAAASCSRPHRTPQLTSRSRGTLQHPSRYLL
ncbi:uncharacterized protein [Macrobrachium rosenbergii]|uniref:uncharacterized protein n=1 Tax=Macrobrachium rosenbergii TaxID=79674 RepID=UPI0034D752A2